ncbi:MAG: ketoacyl-ACP synthase III [Deltaproteobacteria bacterium]|nr:ketoacyl-ACP synthase III [Deltaproteobacteria bacterium]
MKLAGIAACVPKNTVSTTEAYKNFKQFDVDRIIGNTGVKEKREGGPDMTTMDMSITAARALLEKLDWDPNTVDAVIYSGVTPDQIMPSCSYRAQHELGLGERCLVFDVNLGCSGFTHAMIVLNGLIASGVVKRALLMCGDMSTDTFRPSVTNVEHREDLANAILFGDSGVVTAVSSDADEVRSTFFGADGSGLDQIMVPGGGAKNYWKPELFERVADPDTEGESRRPLDLQLRGPQILTFTMKRVPPMLNELLDKAGWERDQVDVYALHQANQFMLKFLARKAKMAAEKIPFSIEKFGNTSSASIPLTMLTSCQDKLRVPTKWVMMGFGVGLSWSGLTMETSDIVTLPLIET